MTISERFSPGNSGFDAPTYPTAFGITFTPSVSGVLLGLLGVGLAGFMAFNLLGPKLSETQDLQGKITQTEGKLKKQQETLQNIQKIVARVNQAVEKNKEVRGLFSTQQALDTLLLDLNRVILSSNAQLQKFNPVPEQSGIVTDSSVGPELNERIKRRVTDVAFEGTFNQTLEVLRAVDRLQTLLVLRDFKMELKPPTAGPEGAGPTNLVTSSFKLYAYVPLTEEELKALEEKKKTPAGQAPNASPAPGQTAPVQ